MEKRNLLLISFIFALSQCICLQSMEIPNGSYMKLMTNQNDLPAIKIKDVGTQTGETVETDEVKADPRLKSWGFRPES